MQTRESIGARPQRFDLWLILAFMFFAPPTFAAPYIYVAVNSSPGGVSVIDTATDAITITIPVSPFSVGVAVSPDGKRVYAVSRDCSGTCTDDGSLSVIDATTNTVVTTVEVGINPTSVAVSRDGKFVYVANSGCVGAICPAHGTISVIDTETDTVIKAIEVGTDPLALAVGPDGTSVFVLNYGSCPATCSSEGTISVIDTSDMQTSTINVSGNPSAIVLSHNGRFVYIADSDAIMALDMATGTTSHVFTFPGGALWPNLAISNDGSRLYAVQRVSDTAYVVDVASGTSVAHPLAGIFPFAIATSADGKQVYISNGSGLYVIDTTTNTQIATVSFGITVPSGIALGPGELIAASSHKAGDAGQQLTGTLPGVANASACTTSDTIIQDSSRGSISLDAASGAWSYLPSSATYSGPDSFTWRAEAPSSCDEAKNPIDPVSNTSSVSLRLKPTLSALADETLGERQSSDQSFTLVGSTPFTLTTASSDTSVVPASSLKIRPDFCGTDDGSLSCKVEVVASDAAGTTTVTLTATDRFGDTVAKQFNITVIAPPQITGLKAVTLASGEMGLETFMLTGTGPLSVTATSSNTTLLPAAGIGDVSACTATGNCSLKLTPTASQSGTAEVTIAATDQLGQTSTGSFTVAVMAASAPSGDDKTGNNGDKPSGGGGGGSTSVQMLLLLLGLSIPTVIRRRWKRT